MTILMLLVGMILQTHSDDHDIPLAVVLSIVIVVCIGLECYAWARKS